MVKNYKQYDYASTRNSSNQRILNVICDPVNAMDHVPTSQSQVFDQIASLISALIHKRQNQDSNCSKIKLMTNSYLFHTNTSTIPVPNFSLKGLWIMAGTAIICCISEDYWTRNFSRSSHEANRSALSFPFTYLDARNWVRKFTIFHILARYTITIISSLTWINRVPSKCKNSSPTTDKWLFFHNYCH